MSGIPSLPVRYRKRCDHPPRAGKDMRLIIAEQEAALDKCDVRRGGAVKAYDAVVKRWPS